MWRREPQRPPPTYEDVRLVAEVLSRINAGLIERHFAISADAANEIIERLVGEKLFGEQQADGWHYPPVRKLRLKRTRRKSKVVNEFKIDQEIADQPRSPEDLTTLVVRPVTGALCSDIDSHGDVSRLREPAAGCLSDQSIAASDDRDLCHDFLLLRAVIMSPFLGRVALVS
jgi:hypothetical protein